MQKIIRTLEDLNAEAARFVQALVPKEQATLIALSGELGAGKTAFTQSVARVLGVSETLTSPTFVLEKIYTLPKNAAFKRLVHIDAYRLETGADLAPLGFDEIIEDSGNLVFCEWPEKVSGALPPPTTHLVFVVNDDGSRTLTYD